MKRRRWLMLAVALGFALMGVLTSRFIGEYQSRSVEVVHPTGYGRPNSPTWTVGARP